MPGSRHSHPRWLAPLVAFGAAQLPALALAQQSYQAKGAGLSGAELLFWACSALTLVGALLTISLRNPISAAMSLVMTLFFTGGIYLSLHATFMAAIQVLVYAGAIMVLFIFVIMSVAKYERQEHGLLRGTLSKLVGLVAVGFLSWRLIDVLMVGFKESPVALREAAHGYGSVHAMGKVLFGDYIFPFEAISILLLVSIVGAVIVSRRPGRTGEGEGA